MNLKETEIKQISKLIQKSLTDEEFELECVFSNKNKDYNSYDDFINVVKRFKNKERFSRFTSNNSLVIFLSNETEFKDITKDIRIIVNGNGLMNMYYKSNKLNDLQDKVSFEKKLYDDYESDRFENENYNFRLNLKKEKNIDHTTGTIKKLVENFKKIPKYFRRKTTFTFYDNDNNFKVDLSMVSRNKNFQYHKTIQESEVLKNVDMSYELEIEYIGNKKKDIKKLLKDKEYLNKIQIQFLEIIKIILQAKQQSMFVIGLNDKKHIENEFNELTGNDTYLPNIVDLENKNIIEIPNLKSSDYPPNIRLDYCVTEKTDGVRQLLFINKDGKCYLKDRNNIIKYTGSKIVEYANSIFDGELIEKNLDGRFIQHYYIFDCYIIKNLNITQRPFGLQKDSNGRFYKIIEFEKNYSKKIIQDESIKKEYLLKIFKKNYIFGGLSNKITNKTQYKIFDSALNILNKVNVKYGGFLEDGHMFPYGTDGLVFQPVNLGVSQEMFEDFPMKVGKTWNSAFRWKPPQDLTIDFMVKFNKENGKNQETFINNTKYIVATLFCKLWKNNVHKKMLAYKLINDGLNFNSYLEDYAFSPIYPYNGRFNSLLKRLTDTTSQIYLLVDKHGKVRCENNQIINDGATVECAYNKERKDEELRWIPKRLRPNKIANAYLTASSSWKLINNPISLKMITNQEDIVNNDLYYNNQSSKETEAMRKFNNFVKTHIIETATKSLKGKIKVLDLCCGKMGDLFKYYNNNVKEIVGIDISPDNILNKDNGAAVRLLENQSKGYEFKQLIDNTLIILGDCTKNISSGSTTNDALNKYYIDILYGRIKPSKGKLVNMYNSGVDGFNLIVCNLAIHYMFNTQETLDTFFDNINENLNNKGYFIGSCLDGNEIVKVLGRKNKIEGFQHSSDVFNNKNKSTKEKSKSKSNKSIKSLNNKLIWSLENKEGINLLKTDKVGQKIDAYMDTFFEPFTENLVDFNFMVDEFKKYDIKLIDSKLFIDEQNSLFNKFKTKNKDWYDKINKHSDIKQWIKFHRWFIFQKNTKK